MLYSDERSLSVTINMLRLFEDFLDLFNGKVNFKMVLVREHSYKSGVKIGNRVLINSLEVAATNNNLRSVA